MADRQASHDASYPDPIGALQQLDPDFFHGYIDARTSVMTATGDGLSGGVKEVILMVIDVILGNEEAAVFHARRALSAGMTHRALLEGLLLVFLIAGAATWGKTGRSVYARIVEDDSD